MPRSYDLNPVAITHHPTQRIDTAIGKLPPFDLQQIVDGFLTALKDLTGIDLTGIRDFLENLFGSIDWSNLPAAGDVWGNVVTTFIDPLINIVQKINELFGPVFGGVDWSDPPTPEELWQQVVSVFIEPLNLLLGPNSPLNLANAFGKLLPFNISGLGLSQLTTAVENLLEGFITAGSVPNEDGWSWDSTIGTPGSAKVVADGTTKTLYAPDVIQVSEGQKLNPLEIKVQYAGVVSGAGQTIKFVLETFSDTLGQVPVGTEIIGAITNPSGSAGPTTLSFPDWTPPAGVLTVLPALVVDSSVSAGSVNWWAPQLEKPLDPVLSGGLPAALNNLGDWIESLVDQLLGAVGLPAVGSLLDKIFDLSDEIGDWLLDTQNTAAGLTDLLGDFDGFLSSSWQALLDGVKGATGGGISDIINRLVNITSGGLFDAAKLSNVTGTAPQSLITGLTNLAAQSNQIGDILAGLVVTPINSTVAAIKDWFTGNINKTQNLTVGGLFDATKLTGLVDPESVGGVGGAADMGAAVQGAIDKIVQAAGDLTGGGFGLDDLLGGLAGLRNTATGANEYVIDIQNQLVENAIGGISAIVKIADYADAATPPSVFTKVLDTGSGSIVTSGGKLVWSGSPGKEMYLYNVEALQSDLFEVSFVMPNAPTHGPFGVDGDNFLYPIGRSNSAGTAMCFAEVGWKSVRIGCLASGVTTWFRSVDWHGGSYEVPSGALVKFKGGTIENGRYFQVFVNNQMVLDAYDNLSVSQLGASFRNCGIGMQDDSDYSTGTVSVWSMVDGNLGIATGTVTGYNNGVLASLKLWTGTAAQYAAIGTKDSATVYVVTA